MSIARPSGLLSLLKLLLLNGRDPQAAGPLRVPQMECSAINLQTIGCPGRLPHGPDVPLAAFPVYCLGMSLDHLLIPRNVSSVFTPRQDKICEVNAIIVESRHSIKNKMQVQNYSDQGFEIPAIHNNTRFVQCFLVPQQSPFCNESQFFFTMLSL